MRISKLFISGGLIFILFGNPALAQKQTPPEGGQPRDFKLPEKQTFTLKNGLSASLVPYGTLPKVSIRVVVRVGNINESENEIWLADLTGDLMKEGTKSRSAEKVAQEAASMGGEINISVGPDLTNISGDVLSEFAPDLIKLMADIVRNPLLPESEIERLQKDMIRNLSIQKTQPRSIAQEKFRKILYPDHPYGRIYPTEAMIQSYNIEKIRSFYDTNFGAARTHMYVAGNFDKRKTESAIRKAFSDWTEGPEPLINVPSSTSKHAIYLINRPDARQSTVYIGLPVIDPSNKDYVALLVTNSLLGGSFASRITSNIREDKGYTYSPFSQVSTRYRDAYWAEIADVATNVTGPSLREIFYEINRLQDEPPSEEELKGIENYLAGTFVLQNSSRFGIIGQLSFLDLHGLEDSYLTEYVKNVYSVTPESVQNMARNYLRDDDMTIVIAGDRKKIYKQVSNYGPVIE
ncbi:MAG: M16 family metallopeptidase [bacterium]